MELDPELVRVSGEEGTDFLNVVQKEPACPGHHSNVL